MYTCLKLEFLCCLYFRYTREFCLFRQLKIDNTQQQCYPERYTLLCIYREKVKRKKWSFCRRKWNQLSRHVIDTIPNIKNLKNHGGQKLFQGKRDEWTAFSICENQQRGSLIQCNHHRLRYQSSHQGRWKDRFAALNKYIKYHDNADMVQHKIRQKRGT